MLKKKKDIHYSEINDPELYDKTTRNFFSKLILKKSFPFSNLQFSSHFQN